MNPTDRLRDHPIFICGHPKSGTSLVKSILDSHPQLIVYPEETVFFRRFLPLSTGLDKNQQLELAEKNLIHIFTWNRETPPTSQDGFLDRDYSKIPFEEIRIQMRNLIRKRYQNEGDILSAAILAYGLTTRQINSNSIYWVEKSPYNEYYTEEIFKWWPEARCIHIFRDPRDNFLSYHRKHPEWKAEFFAANWNRSTDAANQNLRRFGKSRYFILRYEDLVQFPENRLRNLCDYLDIDWNTTLIKPTRAGDQWCGNSMFPDRFQGIDDSPVARWKDNLSPLDAATIEIMSGRNLVTYDYPLEALINLPFSSLVRVRYRAASWPIKRKLALLGRKIYGLINKVDHTERETDLEALDD